MNNLNCMYCISLGPDLFSEGVVKLCNSFEGGLCEKLTQNKINISIHSHELNSRVVGVGVVSDVHSIASGSGLHISVPSHVTLVTSSHWIVTVDPGNLLETGPNAPFMGLVNTAQPFERNQLTLHVCPTK